MTMMSLVLLALAGSSAAPNTAVIDRNRAAFRSCLQQASTSAKPPAVTADKFADYARTQCSAQQQALTAAMVDFDMHNGSSRKSATDGAGMAIDDYLETAKNNFSARNPN
jgi:hypothetical protein